MAFAKPKARRGKYIAEPGDLIQSSLLTAPSLPIDPYPRVLRTTREYREVLDRALQLGDLGFDLETNMKGEPNILGIGYYHPSNNGEAASVPWDDSLARHTIFAAREAGRRLVAHSAMGADRPWVERKLGIKTRIEDWWCSLLSHYAANMHLTKQAAKSEDDDEGGSLGLMNLWSALRCLPLPLYNYKECRGEHSCFGPCPRHTVFEYNGIDAWASPALQWHHQQTFREMEVPDSFIKHLHEMSAICYAMQRRGIRIDRQFLAAFDAEWAIKVKEIEGRLPFNPRSEPAIRAYFDGLQKSLDANSKYTLADTSKETIQDLLEDISPTVTGYKELEDLFLLKSAGKGSKSWFADKYFEPFPDLKQVEKDERYDNGVYSSIHCRWNNTGTATLRLAASRPNMMNIPSKGDLARVRKAILPSKGKKLVKADAKQLEIRIAVFNAGEDPSALLQTDFFTDLVNKSNGTFEAVAERKNASLPPGSKPFTARDIAKITSHSFTNGQGLNLKSDKELATDRMRKLVDIGAVVSFPEWRFRDDIVCFSGIELSRKLFGNYTDDNRILTNSILFGTYLKIVPWILTFQQKVSREVFEAGYVRGLDGSFLRLDSPDLKENFKAAFSKRSQGDGAFFMQSKMREDWERTGDVWTLQVHDEMVKEVPEDWDDARIAEDCRFLETPCRDIPANAKGLLSVPFEVKEGPNWGTLRELFK